MKQRPPIRLCSCRATASGRADLCSGRQLWVDGSRPLRRPGCRTGVVQAGLPGSRRLGKLGIGQQRSLTSGSYVEVAFTLPAVIMSVDAALKAAFRLTRRNLPKRDRCWQELCTPSIVVSTEQRSSFASCRSSSVWPKVSPEANQRHGRPHRRLPSAPRKIPV